MPEFIKAIQLEARFASWCGENYPLFCDGGEFPGIGIPRAIFVRAMQGLPAK